MKKSYTLRSVVSRLSLLSLFAGIAAYPSMEVTAQVSMTVTGSNTQNFNTLITTGSGTFTDNSTIANWYLQHTGTGSAIAANDGSASAGSAYSYGTGTNTDRAIGSLGSGGASAGNYAWGVLLRNNSSQTITNITVAYTGEQWRNSNVAAQTVSFYYKTSSSTISALNPNSNGTWTAVTALDFTSPITGGTAGALDGNATANRSVKSATAIPSLSLTAGDYIMIKWDDPDQTGSDHGMSIDDVTVAWTVTSAAPSNDLCANSIAIPASGPFPYLTAVVNNTSATNTGQPTPSCQALANASIWYTFTPTCSGNYRFSTCPGDAPASGAIDQVLVIGTSTCGGAFTELACSDDVASGVCTNTTSSVIQSVSLTASTTYRIIAYTYDVVRGNIQIQMKMVAPTITSFSSANGCIGSSLTITGTNLGCATSVTIGGTAATITANTATSVTVTVGSGTTGFVVVTSQAGTVSSSGGVGTFTVPPAFNAGTVASGDQTFCSPTTPASMSVTGATGSGSFSYQWYSMSGVVSCPSGGSTAGWTSLGSAGGANTATYTPVAAISASTTYACFVSPGGSPTCGTAQWANNCRKITFTAAPSGTFSYAGTPYCSTGGTATVTPSSLSPGGTYSSAGGLSINSGTGAVNLGASTAGTYTVNYDIAAGGGCSAYNTTASITITTAPSGTFSYAGTPYCSSGGTATVTNVSLSGGGTYSSAGGLSINAGTGAVNLGASTAASYTVNYDIAAGGGCAAFNTTAGITITPAAPAATAGGPQTICQGGTTTSLGGNAASPGTGAWSVVSGGTGTFSNGASPNSTFSHTGGVGPVVVRWTITNAPCASTQADVSITINPAATANANGPYNVCGATAVSISATASGAGTWSGGAGTFASATSASTTYTPDNSEVGSAVSITWTTTGTAPCPNVPSNATVNVNAPATANANGPYTACGTAAVAISATTNGAGTWSGGAGSFASATSASTTYTPSIGEVGTAVTITWTTTGASPCPNVPSNATVNVIGATTATAGTSVGTSGFTANWGAVVGATGYRLDVSTLAAFGTSTPGTSTTETFTAIGGGTSSTYLNRTWTGVDGVVWNAFNARTDQVVFTGNEALALQNASGSYLLSDPIAGGVNAISFDVKQVFTGSGGVLTVSVLSGVGYATSTAIGTIAYTTSASSFSQSFADIQGPIKIQLVNNTAARPAIDNLMFTRATITTMSFVTGYNNLPVAGTSQAVTGLDPATTYYYRVRTEGASCTSANSNVIAVTTDAIATYYSRADGHVTDNIWSDTPGGTAGPAVWTAGSAMVVQSGDSVTNTANVDLGAVTVEVGGILVLNTSTDFRVFGNGDFSGTLTAIDVSTLTFLGTSVVTSTNALDLYNLTSNVPGGLLTDATINIRGSLRLVDGDFDASTAQVTLTSDSVRTGRMGKVSNTASFTGNLTMQRYIPGGATNWRFLGSPVAGQTVANWQDDFFTAGYPGSAYPNFYDPPGSGIFWPSIRYYNETDVTADQNVGIVGVTNNTQPLTAGQGFLAWSGDNFSTTTAFTVDVTGAPNIANTPITLPMSFTSSGSVTEDGWNLVSNPLPSAISFDSISRGSDVADQYWIFNPVTGSHQSYSAGVGVGQVNGKIQSSQAFWLKAIGSNVTTTVSESDKINDLQGGVFGGDVSAVRPIVRLTVASTLNTFSDETVFVFDQGTPGTDAEDALKFTFHTFGAPQVATKGSNGDALSINFFGAYTTDISIPVTVDVDVTGTYTISAAIAGMQGLSCISLEDLSTGSITPLTDGANYSFAINADDDASTPRFLLHGTAPLPLYAENATCANNPNGTATVVVANGPVDITWTDAFGNILLTQNGIENGVAINDVLGAGNYSVHVSPMGACGEVAADFSIEAPAAISALATSTATTCPTSADGSVNVAATGGTGDLAYLWNNGTTGPEFIGAAGEHQVIVTDENGCSTTENFTIAAGEGAIAGFTTGTAVENAPVAFTNTSTSSNAWAWDFGDGNTSTEMNPEHIYTEPGTYTVTLTSTDGTCSDISTQEIVVDITTAVTPVSIANTFNVYATQQQLVIDHAFGNAPVDVAVYDATGRLVMSRNGVVKPNTITLSDRELSTGVWFVRVTSGNTERTFRVPLVR